VELFSRSFYCLFILSWYFKYSVQNKIMLLLAATFFKQENLQRKKAFNLAKRHLALLGMIVSKSKEVLLNHYS